MDHLASERMSKRSPPSLTGFTRARTAPSSFRSLWTPNAFSSPDPGGTCTLAPATGHTRVVALAVFSAIGMWLAVCSFRSLAPIDLLHPADTSSPGIARRGTLRASEEVSLAPAPLPYLLFHETTFRRQTFPHLLFRCQNQAGIYFLFSQCDFCSRAIPSPPLPVKVHFFRPSLSSKLLFDIYTGGSLVLVCQVNPVFLSAPLVGLPMIFLMLTGRRGPRGQLASCSLPSVYPDRSCSCVEGLSLSLLCVEFASFPLS